MKLKMASDNICFFIIEYYSFNEIVDFVLMPLIQSFVATGSIMAIAADMDMVLLRLRLTGHVPALATATGMAMSLDPGMATGTGTGTDTGMAMDLEPKSDTAPDLNKVMASDIAPVQPPASVMAMATTTATVTAMDLDEGVDTVLTSDMDLAKS